MMAKFQFDGDVDLMRKLEKLEDADEICPKDGCKRDVGPLVTGIKRWICRPSQNGRH